MKGSFKGPFKGSFGGPPPAPPLPSRAGAQLSDDELEAPPQAPQTADEAQQGFRVYSLQGFRAFRFKRDLGHVGTLSF